MNFHSLNESRLFSFIDEQSAFTVHFLEAGKLMSDIVTTHNIGPVALEFYRGAVLSSMQMLNFMKATENMGFYIDSEEPYFRFKVEMNAQGTMRTLLLPEEFESFPETVTGKARVTKAFPNQKPYSSVVELENERAKDIVNAALKQSYQTQTHIDVGHKDCSLMFSKLPPSSLSKKFEEVVDLPLDHFMSRHRGLLKEVEQLGLDNQEEIIDFFSSKQLTYLGSKETKFFCPCSKERMISNLLTLGEKDIEDIFKDAPAVETRCDYCNTVYEIKEEDLKAQ